MADYFKVHAVDHLGSCHRVVSKRPSNKIVLWQTIKGKLHSKWLRAGVKTKTNAPKRPHQGSCDFHPRATGHEGLDDTKVTGQGSAGNEFHRNPITLLFLLSLFLLCFVLHVEARMTK